MYKEYVDAPVSKDNIFINVGDTVYKENGDTITVLGIGGGCLNVFATNYQWYDSRDLICIKEKSISRKITDILDEYIMRWGEEDDIELKVEIVDRICALFNGDDV